MGLLLWAHAGYLVLLAAVVSGCIWIARQMDAER
jgi:hypothetical protein